MPAVQSNKSVQIVSACSTAGTCIPDFQALRTAGLFSDLHAIIAMRSDLVLVPYVTFHGSPCQLHNSQALDSRSRLCRAAGLALHRCFYCVTCDITVPFTCCGVLQMKRTILQSPQDEPPHPDQEVTRTHTFPQGPVRTLCRACCCAN